MVSVFFRYDRIGFLWLLIIAFCTLNICLCSEANYLTTADKDRLKQVFTSGLAQKDLTSVHYSVSGYKLLNEKIPNLQELCTLLSDSVSKEGVDTYYYISVTWKAAVCPGTLQSSVISKYLTSQLEKTDATASDLYYSVLGLKGLGQQITTGPKIAKSLQAALKRDDSITSLAYALHVASEIGPADGAFMFDRIEDSIVQADEVDGKHLQFEGGLSITAMVVRGAYKVATMVNKSPPITSDQAVKFAHYFISRKSVQTTKGAWSLLNILRLFVTNKFHKPLIVSVSDLESGKLTVRVTDILGSAPAAAPLPVSLDSLSKASDATVVVSKMKFESLPSDKSLYTLKLPGDVAPGLYKATISVSVADSVLIGGLSNILDVKVTGQLVATDPLLIAAVDSDHFLQPKYNKVTYPAKLPQALEVDSQQRLSLRFTLKEKSTGKAIAVHQSFVRLSHSGTGQEVIFVAEKDSSNNYKLDLDIGAKASEFGQLSGAYRVEILAGDGVLGNSLQWHAADVRLSFTGEPRSKSAQHSIYALKPEIRHLFREPEKRPPVFVSNLFTGLVFVPILILFIMWFKIGINISNFNFRPSTLVFHLGLGSIFVLFGLFWLKLDMFETLKYLVLLGLITFISGNKLLASIASKHKS